MNATNLRSKAQIGARVRRDRNREPHPSHLPNGTPHSPACGSKLQFLGASSPPSESGYPGEAYWEARGVGSFRETRSLVNNPNLTRLATPSERFDYCRAHRTGSRARRRGAVACEGSREVFEAYPTVESV